MLFPGFSARDLQQTRQSLSESICSENFTGPRRSRALLSLRLLQNRELLFQLCAGHLSGPAFDAGACAGALFLAAREAAPFPVGAFQLFPAPVPLPVAGGMRAFETVFLNLICNSFQYAGPDPQLQLRVFSNSSHALLLLKDLGPGLSSSVFFPPTGGLSLARQFARCCGGTFFCESHPGHGVSALLSLPLADIVHPAPPPSVPDLLSDRLSPVFVQLSPHCILPDDR